MGQRGFTLIELIMVIILVGIIAVYASTRFDRAGYDNQQIAHEIIEAIRYAQAQAMSHSGSDSDGDGNFDRYRINFDSAADTYQIVIDDSNSANLGNVANPSAGTATYSQSWVAGVDIASTVASLSFNSRGEPVGLAAAATITINADRVVTVQPITGYAQ